DPDLGDKLKAEWPGILAWMIEGCLDWQERGLAPPNAVTAATAAYLGAEDTVTQWIEEKLIPDPLSWERSSILYAHWKTYAEEMGEVAGSQKRFSQNL